jgi:hypothetical protein
MKEINPSAEFPPSVIVIRDASRFFTGCLCADPLHFAEKGVPGVF